MVPSDPSGAYYPEWCIISSASVFRTYIFVQIESAKDYQGQSVVWNTHTHTHTPQSDFLACYSERGHSRGTIRYVFLQKDSEGAVGKKCSALDWLLSDLGPGEMEG